MLKLVQLIGLAAAGTVSKTVVSEAAATKKKLDD